MINLLPPKVTAEFTYARHNVILMRWIIALSFGIVGIVAITSYGMFSMQHSINIAKNQVDQAETSAQKKQLSADQKRVQEITSSLKLDTQVLSREILFSQLLKQIATVIPAKADLTGLSLTNIAGAGIDLSADASDYTTATQLQVNLQDPANKIFSKADIISVGCGGSNVIDPARSCSVTIRALFAANNPYLFINSKAANTSVTGTTP
jgi:Tfp pilus assembly protein PilN